jgi:hypothetical protein
MHTCGRGHIRFYAQGAVAPHGQPPILISQVIISYGSRLAGLAFISCHGIADGLANLIHL